MTQGILSGLIVIIVSLILHVRVKQKMENDEIADFEKRVKPKFLKLYYLAALPAFLNALLRIQYGEEIVPASILVLIIAIVDAAAVLTVYKELKNNSPLAKELIYTIAGLTVGQFILLTTLTYL